MVFPSAKHRSFNLKANQQNRRSNYLKFLSLTNYADVMTIRV